ncbi:MAG: hypothetical protein MUO40_02430 [Anaerolineaceae bacterium]|nr:hypothetical protein [Anaerolineaceae bacterium]
MTPKISTQKALSSLTHPIALLAMGLILANTFIFQRYFPSWLSGKFSDLGWMICLPLCICLIIALVLPEKKAKYSMEIAIILTGLLFFSVKVLPEANQLARQSFQNLFHIPLKLTLDPTDLIVLPALLIPVWIWCRVKIKSFTSWRYAAIGMVCLVLLADAPAPQDKNFTCLAVDGNSVIVFSNEIKTYTANQGRQVFISKDGGQTWTDYGEYNVNRSDADDPVGGIQLKSYVYACPDSSSSFDLNDPAHEETSFLFVENKGVYISTDSASSFNLEYAAEPGTEFYDAVFAPITGDLIIAAGFDGLLIRSLSGEYTWVLLRQDFTED